MTAVSLANLNLSGEELKSNLTENGFIFESADHAHWRARRDGLIVTLYKSGKILVQGKGADEFKAVLFGESGGLRCAPCAQEPPHQSLPRNRYGVRGDSLVKHQSWIGTDESGKGDYFGPLVVAGVLVNEKNLKQLQTLGIQDSKKMRDTAIQKIAPEIKKITDYAVVTINPAKYNELYEKFKNLNNLLAWGHARVIENILDKTPCDYALSDKFGNESLIKNALMKKGRNINLEQRTKAEEDIAVAAASVLARDEFVRRIHKFSAEYGVNLPKGASEEVVKQACAFAAKYGKDKLVNVAKLHFKTTEKVR